MALQLKIFVPPHPLIKHWLGVARDKNAPPSMFKTAMVELGRWLTYESTREWLPTIEGQVETPLAVANAVFINPQEPVIMIPILRAGLTLWAGSQTVLPMAITYHLGIERNEETLKPSCYLNNS